LEPAERTHLFRLAGQAPPAPEPVADPLSPRLRRVLDGWDLVEPDYQELISELLAGSADFAAIWARQDVRGRPEGRKRLQHAELGRLDLEFTILQVAERPSLRLYLYTRRRRADGEQAADPRRPATGTIVKGLKPAGSRRRLGRQRGKHALLR
jgi:hypothetical protein